tara:strand:- start:141 stop:749 length:609 start_codon:yes stop_codon:yes gene_type:complete
MSIGLTTIFSLKGGTGKTALSVSMSMELERNNNEVPIISNDPVSVIQQVMGNDRGWILPQGQEFPSELNKESDYILDLGGFLEKRIIDVIKKSKNVIIPTPPDYGSIQATISTVNDVKKLNKNLVLVINRIDKKEFYPFYEIIRDTCGSFPVFQIKNSKAFENCQIQKKSIHQMMEDEPVRKRNYSEVQAQLSKIIEHLKGN